ncbi:MAG: hypothetical protein PVI67_12315 [Anaerolineae bacterium]|jgi:hypothetical protein
MGPRITSKSDTKTETSAWPIKGVDPRLIAALTATLVEYRSAVSHSDEGRSPDDDRSNWRVVTRVTQLR